MFSANNPPLWSVWCHGWHQGYSQSLQRLRCVKNHPFGLSLNLNVDVTCFCASSRDRWASHHRDPGKPQLVSAAGNQAGLLRQVRWCKCLSHKRLKTAALFWRRMLLTGAGGRVKEGTVWELREGHPRHVGPARHLRREGAEEGHEGGGHRRRRPGGDPLYCNQ